ncbi:MAG: methanogenesis marker 16 metalloprotein [Candidatus Syntrophoarchaeum sp.]|nr:methanogenesis marker 16 metalloprotein [Candidatus Syntrophoarchaeum sp.]
MSRRTVLEINRRIEDGTVKVMSANELKTLLCQGEDVKFDDVDVVTTGTRGVMSGTMAILSFPVGERGAFERATSVRLNGVPAYPGPCPNERLGIVDLIVYGTSHDRDYGGGHLFRDLVAGEAIRVDVRTSDDKKIDTTIKLDEIPFARMVGVRNAFKNYTAFVNGERDMISTIFSTRPLKGPMRELTFAGCGEINPLENDPNLDTIGIGTGILMNGAEGFVEGLGTRSTSEKLNLSGFADMHEMNPLYMGGFLTSAGPEVINTWAIPIPVLDDRVLDNLKRLNDEIKLPIVDLQGRTQVGEITYADVWKGDLSVDFDPGSCINCETCLSEQFCPTGAFSLLSKKIEEDLCFNCGSCRAFCVGGAFSGDNGSVKLKGRDVPIVTRQSDLSGGIKIADELKNRILNGSFRLRAPVSSLR